MRKQINIFDMSMSAIVISILILLLYHAEK